MAKLIFLVSIFFVFTNTSFAQGGGNGSNGGPGIILNQLLDENSGMTLDEASDLIFGTKDEQVNDLLSDLGNDLRGKDPFALPSKANKKFIRLGNVLDLKISGQGLDGEVIDVQNALDFNYPWIKSINGEIWIREDVSLENYLTHDGEYKTL